uniref:Methyltransferase domain-containing protein n=2 Tax=Arion vulgaris TaxID=1028688 RepID=A0A0B7BJD1_9EUPU
MLISETLNMATICTRLMLSSKYVYSRQKISNISSIRQLLFKCQTLQSLWAASSTQHVVLFSSHSTPEQSLGHIKKQAAVGFKTGGDHYDANRPNYTHESVDLIVSEIESTSKTTPQTGIKYHVLELGAGTGKLTEQLSKKLPENMKYLATEPSENFLGVLKSKGLNVDAVLATADRIPLEDKSVSNVVCAQCFHWFAEKENLESIHRVMAPGGKLIMIWNMKKFDHEWLVAFYEQRKKVVSKVEGSMAYLVNTMEWQRDISVSDNFKLLWNKSLPGINFTGNLEAILANLTTISAYNALPVEQRNECIEELRQVLINWPGLDLKNIEVPFTTLMYVYEAQ